LKISRFEDLKCWEEGRVLARTIYGFANRKGFRRDFRLSDQITGAAISIINNISEGFDAGSKNEFIRFLGYARRSCSEVQNCLYVSLDQNYIEESEFRNTYEHCEKVRKMIDGMIRYLKADKHRDDKETGQPGNRATVERANL